jgi:proline iminopeptidase
MRRGTAAATAAGVLTGLYVFAIRPRLLRHGATDDEVGRALPGDDLISEPTSVSTMAVTIEAPPERVWPWLVQMGFGRAGWYSYDLIDNARRPSADRIVPELQRLELGAHIPSSAGERTWFSVEALDPGRLLALRGPFDFAGRRSYDPAGPAPRFSAIGSWAFVLEPLGGGASTRLIVRSRGTGEPRLSIKALDLLVGQPGHFLMQRKQLAELKRRAEGRSRRSETKGGSDAGRLRIEARVHP